MELNSLFVQQNTVNKSYNWDNDNVGPPTQAATKTANPTPTATPNNPTPARLPPLFPSVKSPAARAAPRRRLMLVPSGGGARTRGFGGGGGCARSGGRPRPWATLISNRILPRTARRRRLRRRSSWRPRR